MVGLRESEIIESIGLLQRESGREGEHLGVWSALPGALLQFKVVERSAHLQNL